MAHVNCPLCGGRVEVPSVETNTRYLCRKCHTPFYLNKAREGVVGEPPSVEQELAELKQRLEQQWKRIPVGRIVAGLVAVVVAGLAFYVFLGPAKPLKGPAEAVAQALAEKDLDDLKAIAAPGTEDDVARWFEAVQPQLVQARASWHSSSEVVEVHVGQEDQAQRRGIVGISIHPPALGSSRDVSLADPSAAFASAGTPFGVETIWTLSNWGRWQLDGRETYLKVRPSP